MKTIIETPYNETNQSEYIKIPIYKGCFKKIKFDDIEEFLSDLDLSNICKDLKYSVMVHHRVFGYDINDIEKHNGFIKESYLKNKESVQDYDLHDCETFTVEGNYLICGQDGIDFINDEITIKLETKFGGLFKYSDKIINEK